MKNAFCLCLGSQLKISFRFSLKKFLPRSSLQRFSIIVNSWLWRFLVVVKLRVVDISLVPLLITFLDFYLSFDVIKGNKQPALRNKFGVKCLSGFLCCSYYRGTITSCATTDGLSVDITQR
ncbi:uncharacterized protein LOC111240995 [Vigna radiata var. radiata]|uniref:Uncharacterized protein LOC111240995 n=1 Tax=Vigna radiata var. radiata TaxID=3916 RepID=A0A3Q0ER99_VIGRR|nr:uncharacterized protein LOC111240995 [Vigna radiata var. radiata]